MIQTKIQSLLYRIDDGTDIGDVRRRLGPADLRHLHDAGQQHKRLGRLRLLPPGHRRHVRGQLQGAKCPELELAAGAELEGAGPEARPVRQRLAHPARSHAQLHQEPLAHGRVGAQLLRPAHRHTHELSVSY